MSDMDLLPPRSRNTSSKPFPQARQLFPTGLFFLCDQKRCGCHRSLGRCAIRTRNGAEARRHASKQPEHAIIVKTPVLWTRRISRGIDRWQMLMIRTITLRVRFARWKEGERARSDRASYVLRAPYAPTIGGRYSGGSDLDRVQVVIA